MSQASTSKVPEYDERFELRLAIKAMATDYFQQSRVGFSPDVLHEVGIQACLPEAHPIVRRFAYSHFFEEIQEHAEAVSLGQKMDVVDDAIEKFFDYEERNGDARCL